MFVKVTGWIIGPGFTVTVYVAVASALSETPSLTVTVRVTSVAVVTGAGVHTTVAPVAGVNVSPDAVEDQV